MILVTGGAGFIGSHLVDRLINLGFKVRVIDDQSATENTNFFWNPKAENHMLDIRDYGSVRHLFEDVDIVYHFAAISRIQPAMQNSENTLSVNVFGTRNVINCSIEAGVKRFVFASSSSIYGNNKLPNIESQMPNCLNVYSESKLLGEEMCRQAYIDHGLETVSLRFFNVYGDRQPDAGEYATVISLFLKQYKNSIPLTIVGDGTQTRSFINVLDVVDACYSAGFAAGYPDTFGQVYNVGTEKSYSINDVAKMFSSNVFYIPQRPGEAKNTMPDISKFSEVFGWKPKISIEDWINERL